MLPSILMRSSFAIARSKMASRFKTRPATSHSSLNNLVVGCWYVFSERHAPAMTPLKGRKIRPIASFFPPMKTDDGSLICVILNSAKTQRNHIHVIILHYFTRRQKLGFSFIAVANTSCIELFCCIVYTYKNLQSCIHFLEIAETRQTSSKIETQFLVKS